jgi:hypothetical protein
MHDIIYLVKSNTWEIKFWLNFNKVNARIDNEE